PACKLVLPNVPIAASPALMTASAASASIRVKPAAPRSSGFASRHNFDASGQPVDSNLISDAVPCDGDNASARLAARKEIDCRADKPVATALRKQRLEGHVGGNLDDGRRCSRNDNPAPGVERRRHLRVTVHGGVAIALEQSGDLDGIAGESLPRRSARNSRQNERREKADDRQHADDLDQRKSGLRVSPEHYRDALLIRLWESPTPPAPYESISEGRWSPGVLEG